MWQEVANISEAQKYMIGELSRGTTLARLVLKRVDFALGKFRIALPKTIDQSQAPNYREESVRLSEEEEMALARVIKSFLRSSRSGILMQDTQLSMSDLRDLQFKELVVPYREEVYWALTGRYVADLSNAEMLTLVRSASFWPFSGFFYPNGITPSARGLEDQDLERVADALCGIAVGAYDERSFLIWWRDNLRPFPSE